MAESSGLIGEWISTGKWRIMQIVEGISPAWPILCAHALILLHDGMGQVKNNAQR